MIEVKGGVVGISDRAVFFTTNKALEPQLAASVGKAEKPQLGEHGIVIEKDKIASVHAIKDANFTTVITAKGLGDDIGVHTQSEALQQQIVANVQRLLGQAGNAEELKAGLFQRAGKSIVLAVCSLILTGCFYFIVSSINYEAVDLAGKNARKEEFFYSIAHTLGPVGTLVVGGLIAALFVFQAYKSSKKSWVINRYSF